MSFFFWLAAIALIYVSSGGWLFLLADYIQRRAWKLLPLLLVGPAAACLAALIGNQVAARIQDSAARTGLSAVIIFGTLFACVQVQKWITLGKSEWRVTKRRRELSRQVKLHQALITGAIVFSVPFYWLITTSLKPDNRTNIFPPDLVPMAHSQVTIGGEPREVFLLDRNGKEIKVAKINELANDEWEVQSLGQKSPNFVVKHAILKPDLHLTAKWSNFSEALAFLPPEYNKGLRPLWNTIYVTLLTIIGTVFSSSLVAFAFARLRWPGRDLLFVVLLATMMIPGAVTMLPVFLIYRSLGWVDTLRPLWFPAFFGGGFNIFLLRQFFLTIPNELEEAARIDGCSYFMIYWKIMLPLIKPALAALTIFAFMGSWNNFQGPLIYISSPEKMTLAYALQLFQGAHGGEPAMMTAAATLVMLPVLAVFFFTQRYMIQGVTLTGIKG